MRWCALWQHCAAQCDAITASMIWNKSAARGHWMSVNQLTQVWGPVSLSETLKLFRCDIIAMLQSSEIKLSVKSRSIRISFPLFNLMIGQSNIVACLIEFCRVEEDFFLDVIRSINSNLYLLSVLNLNASIYHFKYTRLAAKTSKLWIFKKKLNTAHDKSYKTECILNLYIIVLDFNN